MSDTITLSSVIQSVIQIIFAVAGAASLFMIIMGGISWTLSGGNEEKIDKAKAKLRNAIIGLTIVFSSYAILGIVGDVFGVNLTSFNLTGL